MRPTFFAIENTYPALDIVTRAYPRIREEFDALERFPGRLNRGGIFMQARI
jgi:hypothetical protein